MNQQERDSLRDEVMPVEPHWMLVTARVLVMGWLVIAVWHYAHWSVAAAITFLSLCHELLFWSQQSVTRSLRLMWLAHIPSEDK